MSLGRSLNLCGSSLVVLVIFCVVVLLLLLLLMRLLLLLHLQLSISLLVLLLRHLDATFTIFTLFIAFGQVLLVMHEKQLAQLVFVDVNVLLVFFTILLSASDHVAFHHFVFDVLFILDFLLFVGVLHVFLIEVLVGFLVFIILAFFLILAFLDDLGLVILIFLLLNTHLVVLILGNTLTALNTIITIFSVFVVVLDLTFTLIADFALLFDLVHHVGIVIVDLVTLLVVVALRSLIIS